MNNKIMNKKLNHTKLLIASNNPGKVREIKELLAPYNIEMVSAIDFNIEEPEETGLTFIENSRLKAEYYGKKTNLLALADDSGLSIDALEGFPGIYSARIAGENKNYEVAFSEIENRLIAQGLQSSTAHFTCALSLYYPDGCFKDFEGIVKGRVSFPIKGAKGFGYDPIFIPDGYSKSFAEMNPIDKNTLSHRGIAFQKLVEHCFN